MLKKIVSPRILIIAAVILSVYVVGRLVVFHQVKKVIQKELADLEQQGIELNVENLRVGPWQNRVQLDSVRMRFIEGYGRDNKVQASLGNITLRGIGLLRAVLKKELHINSVQLSRPFIRTMVQNEEATDTAQKVKNSKEPAIKKLLINNLHIYKGEWKLNENTDTPVRITTLDEVHLSNILIENNPDGPLQWQVGKTTASEISVNLPKDFHTYSLQHIDYNKKAQTLNIDSIRITPHYNKAEFPKKAGKEYTRLTVVIPYVKVSGCDLKSTPEISLNAQEVHAKMHLESYFDKRPPFENPANKVLPIEFMQRLPIILHVDTLHLEDSYAEHEEFPEIGEKTGRIFFNKLNATIANITSRKPVDEKKLPTLSATAMFMGIGDLRTEFGFPATPDGVYYASGALYNFPMEKLNVATEPLAKLHIESGQMHSVKFRFQYTDARSDGELEMNYNDLKAIVLKKDDPTEKAGFANFLLNTFILKKDLDDSVEKEKRTGTIQFFRDRRRALFYYWWKSVLSGVLGTYNIDKVPQPKDLPPEEQKK